LRNNPSVLNVVSLTDWKHESCTYLCLEPQSHGNHVQIGRKRGAGGNRTARRAQGAARKTPQSLRSVFTSLSSSDEAKTVLMELS
jgi:hypothetical protein